jgi:predicted chitinase
MKKILCLLILVFNLVPVIKHSGLQFGTSNALFAQCGSSAGEEQHTGGGIGGATDMNQTNNDFNSSSISISNPASTNIDELVGQIRAFLNEGADNPATNPDFIVNRVGGEISIQDMGSGNLPFLVAPDLARNALNFYDPSRSTITITNSGSDEPPIIDPVPCPTYVNSALPGYFPYDPWADPNNPFNQIGGGGTDPDDDPPQTSPCPTDATVQVTRGMISHLYPNANRGRTDLISRYINQYSAQFGVSGRKELAYFLGQVLAETDGFRVLEENYRYTSENIIKHFKKKFTLAEVNSYVNCPCVFDRAYCCKNENGDESSQDGSKYSGKGIIQLTFKESYRKFTEYYHAHFSDQTTNFVNNPELLRDNLEFGVIAALWEFGIDKRHSTRADKNVGLAIANDDIDAVSSIINGGHPANKRAEREKMTLAILNLWCL